MPKIATGSSAILLLALICVAAADSFAQRRSPRKSPAGKPQPVTQQQVNDFAKDYWDQRIVKCGDYQYFFRPERSGGLTLFQVKGLTVENTGRSALEPGEWSDALKENGYSKNLRWSGSSTARFESYRKKNEPDENWGPWLSNGSETVYYDFYDEVRVNSPGEFFSSCAGVMDFFTLKTDQFPHMPESISGARFKNVDGGNFTLADYKGKVILVNLWATWCGPCRMEIPALIELQKKYRDKGFAVIGLDIDSEDIKTLILPYRERMMINYTLATGEGTLLDELIKISQMNGIPQSFLIDRQGRLIRVFKGYNPALDAPRAKMVETVLNY